MKKNTYKIKIIAAAFSAAAIFSSISCVNDLEQVPITDVTSLSVFQDFANYPSALAKVYGGFANGGQESNGGNSDVGGIDGNFSQYTRILHTLQCLPTDEAVIAWNDGTLQTIHRMTWDSSNEFVSGMYYRLYTEIAFCNEFIRNTTDEKLAGNNITGANLTEAKYMHAEARYLRALAYYHALDLFGNVPFVTESNYLPGSTTPPPRTTRAELFNYVESELLACEQLLKAPKSNQYGRADQAAVWSLLARLYLNSQVYNNTNHYSDCITYSKKVISAGYGLKGKYGDLFLADNDKNNPEAIFTINFDGQRTQTSGGTTYMVHAAVGGTMPASQFGINGGWSGLRTTSSYVGLFNDTNDQRRNFYTSGQNLEINDLGSFNDGYAFVKYKNLTSGGNAGSDNSGNFCDADIPMFRLADVYLMYAEAVLRGGSGGDPVTALGYVNALRTRAGAAPVTSINTDYILDERGRELGWELTRRTDLIRYGKFTTGTYLWAWKGGVKAGKAVENFRNLYPIPAKDIVANPNLIQNPGY